MGASEVRRAIFERIREVTIVMNVAQIKDEIRKLDRIDQIGICRWLDQETVDDIIVRIGMDRARHIRQEIERKFNVTSPERQAAWKERVSPRSEHRGSGSQAV
jgi:hypothetical protein